MQHSAYESISSSTDSDPAGHEDEVAFRFNFKKDKAKLKQTS